MSINGSPIESADVAILYQRPKRKVLTARTSLAAGMGILFSETEALLSSVGIMKTLHPGYDRRARNYLTLLSAADIS